MMDNQYYINQIDKIARMKEELLGRQASLLRTALTLHSTLLAVLSALLPLSSPATTPRVLYLLTLVLLLLGSLSSMLTLYDLVELTKRGLESFHSEVLSAIKDDRPAKFVMVDQRRRTKVFAAASATTFVLALLSLLAHATVVLFFAVPSRFFACELSY